MMREIPLYRRTKIDIDAEAEEMNETDRLVKHTGGQEVQNKVLALWSYRRKGMSNRHLFSYAAERYGITVFASL